jgi:DNA-binding MarR family transcriptional regulator
MTNEERTRLIEQIVEGSGALFRALHAGQMQEWLTVDLTMPQLKALMCVAQTNGATSGQIARSLGVGLSTTTGIVDRLSEQGLVTRQEDPEDRRVTRVLPTARARALVDALLRYRNERMTALLAGLDVDQLRTIEQALVYLRTAAERLSPTELPAVASGA